MLQLQYSKSNILLNYLIKNTNKNKYKYKIKKLFNLNFK